LPDQRNTLDAGLFVEANVKEDELNLKKVAVKFDEFLYGIHRNDAFNPGGLGEIVGKSLSEFQIIFNNGNVDHFRRF
jgi:hypothetical protein